MWLQPARLIAPSPDCRATTTLVGTLADFCRNDDLNVEMAKELPGASLCQRAAITEQEAAASGT